MAGDKTGRAGGIYRRFRTAAARAVGGVRGAGAVRRDQDVVAPDDRSAWDGKGVLDAGHHDVGGGVHPGQQLAVVVDPVLSARGKVVIGAFRNIPKQLQMTEAFMSQMGKLKQKKGDPREKTSFIGHTIKPSPKTVHVGLNKNFYMMPIDFRMNPQEEHMLSSLHRPTWSTGFEINSFQNNDKNNLEMLKNLTQCAKMYRRTILDEANVKSNDELELMHIGKIDPKLYFKENSDKLSSTQSALLARLHVTNATF